MSSIWVVPRLSKACGANRANASRTCNCWVAAGIVFAGGIVDNRPMMAGNRLGAGDVRRRSRDSGIHLRIGRIRANETIGSVQPYVVNRYVCIVLWRAVIVD